MIDPVKIRNAVRKRYGEVAGEMKGKFNYPTGRNGLLMLGYDRLSFEDLSKEIIEFFCGVGNPFSMGEVKKGETILDIGCGAGVDLILAGRRAGPDGKVFGIDITVEMKEKATDNLKKAGIHNGEIYLAPSEEIPFEDNTFDLIISNGVLNLSPLKEKTFGEIYRVMKEKGRFQFADIILKEDLPPETGRSLKAWSD